jgi:hypothetical protein
MSQRLLIAALAVAGSLAAQDPPSRAGRISYITGAVSFQPSGVTDWVAASVNRPLTMGDQLYSDAGGRAEVHVPGAAFRLGDRTAFEFMNLDDRMVQVRLSEGAMDVRVRNLDGNIEIDTPNLAFTVSQPGEYRFDTNSDGTQTLVTAREGEGQVTAGGGSFTLHAGQQAVIMGQDQTAQYKVNAAPGPDGFDNWVMSRNQREERYSHPRYVSSRIVGYEDLDEYGTWRSAPDYGQVWVPNGVAAAWAPYHDGHWAWVDPWGWTWVDDAPWGFAPFHYGRWAFVSGYWGWCPGPMAASPVYAPALVAWVGFGAGFGVSLGGGPAVGWFPLGPRDVYIPSFNASAAFVTRINITNTTVINTTYVNNVYNGYVRTQSVPIASYMNRSVPGAVVAVPQTALTSARPVQQVAMRVEANQIASIRAVQSSPRVAPQVASVLGRSAGGNVARPTAAVLGRQIVARTAPPARPPSFQQRQGMMAKDPGRPLPVAQVRQMATSGAASSGRPPVRVMTQTHAITPQVTGQTRPAAPQATPQRAAPAPPATPARTQPRRFEPPAAQRATTPQNRQPAPVPARQPPTPAYRPPPAAAPHQAAAPPAQPRREPSAPVQTQHRPVTPPPQPARPAAPHVQAPQHPAAAPPRPAPQPAQQPQRAPAPRVQAPQHPAAAPPRQPPQPAQQPQRAPAPRVQAPQHPAAAPPRPAPQPPARPNSPPDRKPEHP